MHTSISLVIPKDTYISLVIQSNTRISLVIPSDTRISLVIPKDTRISLVNPKDAHISLEISKDTVPASVEGHDLSGSVNREIGLENQLGMEERLATRAVHALDCPRYDSGPSRLHRTTYVSEIVDQSRKEKFENGRGDTGGRRRNLNREDYERVAVELYISAVDEWVRDCGGLCGRQKNKRD
ncbi:hypothetical protein E6C27_scaffold385G001590 [Cucumis melo var. makuwa]|uniref:NBS-LRR type resistance protein n=1 Tax=Cucumis melo var. makuwa TaxID=1194695 RepID=A0A5A7U342_CUCMM|nr:hypothetical protein E6C27_scaffold385G001590 [Cucumis melo var. makuwa]